MFADKLKIAHEFYYYVDLKRASHFKGAGFGLIAEEHVFANFIAYSTTGGSSMVQRYLHNIIYIIIHIIYIIRSGDIHSVSFW